jgi:hypothetical protein
MILAEHSTYAARSSLINHSLPGIIVENPDGSLSFAERPSSLAYAAAEMVDLGIKGDPREHLRKRAIDSVYIHNCSLYHHPRLLYSHIISCRAAMRAREERLGY